MDEVAASYEGDSHAQSIIARLVVNSAVVPHFTWQSGLLRYKNRIWIGHHSALQKKIIAALHDSAVGGHSGVPVTYSRIKQLFAWAGMKNAVHAYVTQCLIANNLNQIEPSCLAFYNLYPFLQLLGR